MLLVIRGNNNTRPSLFQYNAKLLFCSSRFVCQISAMPKYVNDNYLCQQSRLNECYVETVL